MEFVLANEEDKNEILSLYRSLVGTPYCAWTDIYPGEQEVNGDMARGDLYCLKDDGKIVGTISIDMDPQVEELNCWTNELAPGRELSRLGVSIERQNCGIAKELLKNGMLQIKKRGYRSVHFLVCKHNIKAIRAYEPFGFNIVGECELFGEEWWCYEKEL